MADHELTREEGFRLLDEVFGSKDPSTPPTRGRRKYVLEYQDGEPVFRFAEIKSETVLPRSELDVFWDDLMTELFGPDRDGDEIVPQKLAKLFPGAPSPFLLKTALGLQIGLQQARPKAPLMVVVRAEQKCGRAA
jgi:hypothetical protein